MSLMAPLSDLLQAQRQVAVLALQFGDGITMGLLEIAAIPFDRWFKFSCLTSTIIPMWRQLEFPTLPWLGLARGERWTPGYWSRRGRVG